MAIRWITKKGKNGDNRHIPINESHRVREKEISLDTPKQNETIKNMDDKTKILYQLGFLTDDGKLNIYPYILNQFFTFPEDGKIHNLVEINGKYIKYLSTDSSGEVTIKTIIPNDTHLENGKYELFYDETNNSFKLQKLEPDDTRPPVKDYNYTSYPEGKKIRIDGETYKKMMTILNNFLPDNKYILIIKKIGKGNYAEMRIIDTDFNFHSTVDLKIPDKYVDRDIFTIVDGKAFNRALKMINGTKFSGSIDLDIQNQYYPLILYQKDKKSHINKYGIIAPIGNLEDYHVEAPILSY